MWVFFALVQREGLQTYVFSELRDCHEKLEETRQSPDVLVMSKECFVVKLRKP